MASNNPENQKLEKQKFIEKNLQLFWHSYIHMYNVRSKSQQDSINFLLIVSTFLPILSVTLYTTNFFEHYLILVPIFFQLLALLLLFKTFYSTDYGIPWLELKEDIFENYENFNESTLALIKAAETNTYSDMIEKGKIIKNSLRLLLISLFLLSLSIVFILDINKEILYFLVVMLFLIFVLLLEFYSIKGKDKFKANYKNNLKKIDEWLNPKK